MDETGWRSLGRVTECSTGNATALSPWGRGVGGEGRSAVAWLFAAQNADGGWGGAANTPSAVEETALAVEVLLDAGPAAEAAASRGLAWLFERVESGGLHDPSPIGFYFAKLWYYEKLYPIIFAVAALGRARRRAAVPGGDS